ncbi:MAG: hypothetical protein ACR2IK_13275 [Chloroflexota bacterium]
MWGRGPFAVVRLEPAADQVGNRQGTQAYDTTRDGSSATLDLAAKYPGFFKDVPGGYFFGWHFANESDPDRKAYPFIWARWLFPGR